MLASDTMAGGAMAGKAMTDDKMRVYQPLDGSNCNSLIIFLSQSFQWEGSLRTSADPTFPNLPSLSSTSVS